MIILHLKEITLSTKLLVFNASLLLSGLMWKATYFHFKGGDRYLIGNVVTLQKMIMHENNTWPLYPTVIMRHFQILVFKLNTHLKLHKITST